MQHIALTSFDKERCRPFFDRLTEYFQEHHHSEQQDAEAYEELLYRIRRPYTPQMLDMIDDWMGLERRDWREETQREVMLSLYAIRYPDTLLIESLTDKARSVRLPALHPPHLRHLGRGLTQRTGKTRHRHTPYRGRRTLRLRCLRHGNRVVEGRRPFHLLPRA